MSPDRARPLRHNQPALDRYTAALSVAVAGALLVIGIAVIPGIVLRLDDMHTAPPWIWVGFVSWLGIHVGYPAWAIWSGLANQSAR